MMSRKFAAPLSRDFNRWIACGCMVLAGIAGVACSDPAPSGPADAALELQELPEWPDGGDGDAGDTADLDASDGDVADLPEAEVDDASVDGADLDAIPEVDMPADLTDEEDSAEPPVVWLSELDSVTAWLSMADGGDEVKYLAPVAERTPPEGYPGGCAFQNMAIHAWHLTFLRTFPGLESLTPQGYASLVLARNTRVWWGGSLYRRPSALHPISGVVGIFAYTIYGEARADSVQVPDIAAVDAILKNCAHGLADRLVFVPSTDEQRQLVFSQHSTLEAMGVAVVFN